jgi:hypothetical protein
MCIAGTFVVKGRIGRDMKVNMEADINRILYTSGLSAQQVSEPAPHLEESP